MISLPQYFSEILVPSLNQLSLYSTPAAKLIMGTVMQESRFRYLVQLGNGPALGLAQMEPRTHDDIWDNYLKYREGLADPILRHLGSRTAQPDARRMVWDLKYSAMMCRIHYRRVPSKLPTDPPGFAAYWKQHYNTRHGAGTVHEFLRNWEVVEHEMRW